MSDAGRSEYPYWMEIPTRWMDMDAYGHVNNAQYYSFFDSIVTTWLVREGGVDPHADPIIALCVESKCSFHAPLGFPEMIAGGLRAAHVGRSSVRYELALYAEGSDRCAATGYFVHVHVDRDTRTSAAISDALRARLEQLRTPEAVAR